MSMVADNHTIINTQGIRFVEKIDQLGSSFGPDRYQLRVTYKGAVLYYSYANVEQRNGQYDALRIALGVSPQTRREPAEAERAVTPAASEAP